jgi:hypothetical protein
MSNHANIDTTVDAVLLSYHVVCCMFVNCTCVILSAVASCMLQVALERCKFQIDRVVRSERIINLDGSKWRLYMNENKMLRKLNGIRSESYDKMSRGEEPALMRNILSILDMESFRSLNAN